MFYELEQHVETEVCLRPLVYYAIIPNLSIWSLCSYSSQLFNCLLTMCSIICQNETHTHTHTVLHLFWFSYPFHSLFLHKFFGKEIRFSYKSIQGTNLRFL
ncbi:hypothetical protein CsSME_00031064 [Camellia sinensis var. sinensis]